MEEPRSEEIETSISTNVSDKFKPPTLEHDHVIFVPERVLMLAVLERAIRDLASNIEWQARRDAIKWFQAFVEDRKDNTIRFTFCQIVETIGFGAHEIAYIMRKVKDAEENEKERVRRLKTEKLN